MRKKFFYIILIIITLLSGCGKNSLLEVHIIDVGQGDSILIKTPNSKTLLIDGGTNESEHIVKSYLKKQKVKIIDFLIATHPDSDHIGGLDAVVNKFNVKGLYLPEQTITSNSYNDLISACNQKNVPLNYLYKGDNFSIDNYINLFVLSPSYIQDDNNLNSIVFKLSFKNKSFLFTGDAESSNESDIINSFNLEDIDFLKVGHHGSKSSTTSEFLDETTPDVAVISCGYKNQYGHPHNATLKNLKDHNVTTYRTDLSGDIVFYSNGEIIYTKKKYK
ncbi:ComEC/Rec2 family competence protein [Romboutsia lituseburensis]|uniref:ComEC/Rec2 family competence protein n=1 Tax=Romboutsia lituseburensis TaxID=1537 RepID=UPI00215ABFBC|nr:MBL fold metallo-hydrolase [Romboutsia lituseburensis]MCR8746547.1 MBL fold metallo-hydrolase [Romboutsia lituseburensis]